jgi:sulfate permease, SulP family
MKAAKAVPRRPWPVLRGVLPLAQGEIPGDVLAGATLAALGIPEVLGYAKIAGMPVVTGLYTILLPMAVFALLGASRHLAVGADSATAAIFAAGASGLAQTGSPRYVALAGLGAILVGVLLLVARLVRLGFLANFLSRTALVGFLTGVGIQVAAGQIGEMLGVGGSGQGALGKLADAVRGAPHTRPATLAVSLAVIAVIAGMRSVTKRIPGALIAVVGAIIVSRAIDLGAHGVAVLGPVPTGLPRLGLPRVGLDAAPALLGTVVSMFVVILAQSAATSRAYAARYDELSDENRDLVGLAVANVAAGLAGTFVVNGSPTKTEMVASAGGRSQLSQLTTTAVVLVVLLFLTGPLQYLPVAMLAAVVFLIGIELIDVRGMRAVFRARKDEFVIALLTAAAVVFVGVEQGIVLAMALSLIDHLRYSYNPRNVVLQPLGPERWRSCAARAGERTLDGLIVYRFGNSLYYANAHSLLTDVAAFLQDGRPLRWFCLDGAAMGDVDFTAAHALRRIHAQLQERDVRLVFAEMSDYVRGELDRYGITVQVEREAYFDTVAEVIEAYRAEGGAHAGGEQASSPHGTRGAVPRE